MSALHIIRGICCCLLKLICLKLFEHFQTPKQLQPLKNLPCSSIFQNFYRHSVGSRNLCTVFVNFFVNSKRICSNLKEKSVWVASLSFGCLNCFENFSGFEQRKQFGVAVAWSFSFLAAAINQAIMAPAFQRDED